MNYLDSDQVSGKGEKSRFPYATRALIVGLALLLPSVAALAINNPIPGVDIIVKKNPSGIQITTPTGADGAYKLEGLASGSYDLFVAGQRVQTITVGNQGSISGMLSREPDGTASISVIGTASNGARLIRITNVRANANALGKANQPIITKDVDNLTTRQSKVDATTGGIRPILDIDDTHGTDSIVAAPTVGDGKRPLISRVGDPIPVTGLNLPGYPITSITISLPANPDAKVMPPSDVKPGITGGPYLTVELKEVLVSSSKIAENNSPSPANRGIGVAVGDVNGDGRAEMRTARNKPHFESDPELPSKVGDPVPGTELGLEGDPEGVKVSVKTDSTGAFHFDKLPAGKYKLTLPGLPPQSLTVGVDGIAGGKVMKGSDGGMSIFDRWGNSLAVSGSNTENNTAVKAAAKPGPGFIGSGFTGIMGSPVGGIFPGMSPGGAGPLSPSPGLMSPGPMGPGPMGAGPAGPGGAMRR